MWVHLQLGGGEDSLGILKLFLVSWRAQLPIQIEYLLVFKKILSLFVAFETRPLFEKFELIHLLFGVCVCNLSIVFWLSGWCLGLIFVLLLVFFSYFLLQLLRQLVCHLGSYLVR